MRLHPWSGLVTLLTLLSLASLFQALSTQNKLSNTLLYVVPGTLFTQLTVPCVICMNKLKKLVQCFAVQHPVQQSSPVIRFD